MNRAPRAAVLGVLLLSPVALAACSAGQVSQTATQEQNLGNSADVGDLALRGLQLPYPTGGVYESGDDARLVGEQPAPGAGGLTREVRQRGVPGSGQVAMGTRRPSCCHHAHLPADILG